MVKCNNCGGEMRPLFTSLVCGNECDLRTEKAVSPFSLNTFSDAVRRTLSEYILARIANYYLPKQYDVIKGSYPGLQQARSVIYIYPEEVGNTKLVCERLINEAHSFCSAIAQQVKGARCLETLGHVPHLVRKYESYAVLAADDDRLEVRLRAFWIPRQ